MNILVTGGRGIWGGDGSRLLEAGHQVTVVDNFMYDQTSLLDCCHYPGLTIIRGDARDEKLLGELIKNLTPFSTGVFDRGAFVRQEAARGRGDYFGRVEADLKTA